jgi:hypothetical protein
MAAGVHEENVIDPDSCFRVAVRRSSKAAIFPLSWRVKSRRAESSRDGRREMLRIDRGDLWLFSLP